MAADGDEGDKKDQEEEIEEQDEKEVIVKLQEQLDEIRTNMAANSGRLDDAVLNKLLNIYTSSSLYAQELLYVFPQRCMLKQNVTNVYIWKALFALLLASFPALRSVL